MTSSLILTVIAQQQMATSWRIGIDTNHTTELITTGLFAHSRHPIYLGLHLFFIGIFLTMPTATVLISIVAGISCMHMQVKIEEEYLTKKHGEKYLKYKSRVRKWL